jgi:hypothetical protein
VTQKFTFHLRCFSAWEMERPRFRRHGDSFRLLKSPAAIPPPGSCLEDSARWGRRQSYVPRGARALRTLLARVVSEIEPSVAGPVIAKPAETLQ